MFLTQLPRLSIPIQKSSSLLTKLFLHPPKSNFLTTIKPNSLSQFSTTTLLPSQTLHQEPEQEEGTHIKIPQEKLFFPPDTDISAEDLSARILKGSNIVLSRYANDAHVVQAEFVKSSVETDQCPADGLPEFALVGRSNVGKSSLLNSLVRRKKLALTSKKPVPANVMKVWRN